MENTVAIEEVYPELLHEYQAGEPLSAEAVEAFMANLPEWDSVEGINGPVYGRRLTEFDKDFWLGVSLGEAIKVHRLRSSDQLLAYVEASNGVCPEQLRVILELEGASLDSSVAPERLETLYMQLLAAESEWTLAELREHLRVQRELEKEAKGVVDGFTDKQREVLRQIDRPTGEIAYSSRRGESTVRTHIHNMMDQAGFRSRVELLLLAFRAGELSDKSQPEHAGVSRLSAREKEVTRLAVFTQQEVAARREISVSTVRAHMHNAMQKADVPHRAGLVAATIRENIITIDEFVLRSDEADSES